MSDHVFAPPAPVSVPVAGGGLFPVRRVYCVGRNYAEHAREMGHDPDAAPPFFFDRPADALVVGGAAVPYPPLTAELHHEIEFVVAIGRGGADIAPEAVLEHVYGYAVGIDLTRRDLQEVAKKTGRPWTMAKGFDHSAPISDIAPAARIGHPTAARIALSVDGELRQEADIADMIWDVPHLIAELSRAVALAPGDLVFTGTPAGVGPLVRGNRVEGVVDGVGAVATTIA